MNSELLAFLTGIIGSPVMDRLIGPPLGEYGEHLKELAKKRLEKPFQNAKKKLGQKLDEPGSIPPRIFVALANQVLLSEDEIQNEYLGGVLASSRTKDGKNDRGINMIALISRLSSIQLRAHYVLMRYLRKDYCQAKFGGMDKALAVTLSNTGIWMKDFKQSMNFSPEEEDAFPSVFQHIAMGLESEDLARFMGKDPEGDTITVCATYRGIELFLWGNGMGEIRLDRFASTELLIPDFPEIQITEYPPSR